PLRPCSLFHTPEPRETRCLLSVATQSCAHVAVVPDSTPRASGLIGTETLRVDRHRYVQMI
ncbi:MAG: hypothetical protein ACUVTZ_13250, partial [Armatimonadota bacterium]